MNIIISGGGTGGHIFPAIAIADAIRRKHPEANILFVGAQGKMEMERVPKAGYPIEGLWISGFQRSLSLSNLAFPFKLMSSLWKSRGIIKRFKPHAAVGVGGYASGALLRMAGWMGIPSLIHEQNSFAGATNRLLAKSAQKVCIAYPDMERFFPKDKLVFTGNPIRQDILEISGKRSEAIQFYGLQPERKTILVVGGSLGARTLNDSLRGALEQLGGDSVQVLWQTGKLYWEEFKGCAPKQPHVKLVPFIERMDLAYAAADLVISRAGALSISELCAVGKPAIFVPSPNVTADHQTHNAMALVKQDAALLVKDSESRESLVPKALQLLADQALGERLARNIRRLAVLDAADRIAEEVMALVRE